MALQLPNNPSDEEVDMAPMIDMVFLLLVFFMVVSNLQVEEHITIAVPEASHAKMPEDRSGRINISVLEDGTYYLGAKPIAIEDLKVVVEERVAVTEKLKVFLRGDANADHGDVRKAMKLCAEAGISDIIFATHDTD